MTEDLFQRARRFFLHDLWHLEVDDRSWYATPIRLLQFGFMVVEGFVRDELLLRASALTYIASLALIPALVVVLSVLEGLGVTEDLVAVAIDYLAIPGAREMVLSYVRAVDLSRFGTLGAILLFLTTVLALRHGEHALNEIWGVVHGRSWTRRFTDYLAVMIIAPLLLTAALSLATTLQSDPIVSRLLQYPLFQALYSTGLRYAPFLLLVGAFTFIYWFLPNTQVRVVSALFGGIVAALLFVGAQSAYVQFNVGAARYSAFFGAAATVPLLLVWIYVSMAIFLLGAEISYAHQNLARYRREVRGAPPSPAEREAIALCLALEIARAFRDRLGPCSADRLADEIDVSVRAVRDLLGILEHAGLVVQTLPAGREEGYVPGRPPADTAIGEVLGAVRSAVPRRSGGGEEAELAPGPLGRFGTRPPNDTAAVVVAVMSEMLRAIEPIAAQRTLWDLLRVLPARLPADPPLRPARAHA